MVGGGGEELLFAAKACCGLRWLPAVISAPRLLRPLPLWCRHFRAGRAATLDLPDVAAGKAGGRVVMLPPVDAMKRPVDLSEAPHVYERTATTAPDGFQIVAREPAVGLGDQYLRLLGR